MTKTTSKESDGTSGNSTSLQALVVVAARLGLDLSVDQLYRRFALPPGEPDTPTLISILKELGLEGQALRMSFHELPRINDSLPALLRAKDGGALILEEARSDAATGTVAVVRDPTAPDGAVVAIDELHLAEVWEGEAILVKRKLSMASDEQPFGIRWLAGQLSKERKLFRYIVLAAFVSTIFAVSPPLIFRIVLDRVLIHNSYATLNVLVVMIVFLLIFETVMTHLRGILVEVVSTRIDGRLNLLIGERLLKLPMEFFERNPTGKIQGNLQQVQLIRNFMSGQLLGAFLDTIPLLVLIPLLFLIEWHLALIAVSLAMAIAVMVSLYVRPLARAFGKVVSAENAKNSHLTESIYGIKTIKSLALEGRRRREWDRRVANTVEARHAFGVLANYPHTFSLPLDRLIYSGCLAAGAYMILYYATLTTPGVSTIFLSPPILTPGQLIAFAMLSMRFSGPLVHIAQLQLDLAQVRGAVIQVASVINVTPEPSHTDGMRLPIKGEVTFKDVRFRYVPEAPLALDGVSFQVPAGSNIGIMGRSGSGKTTVTRLLQSLNASYEGTIKIDGMDLGEIDLMHLRTNIGVVPQENFLFTGTIRDNIAMARPSATFADVVRASQLSGAAEFIENLPRGYDTPLQEGGSNLSGGQRQRIALARALIIDPPILILDEATSALDAESEAIVNANLKRIAKGRTVLSISHRLSMLVECDGILVLERGKVYDYGTHEELVRRCDIYKHMWYQQNRHLDPRNSERSVALSTGASR
jgi:ATP-binding cassette subfamily B protein